MLSQFWTPRVKILFFFFFFKLYIPLFVAYPLFNLTSPTCIPQPTCCPDPDPTQPAVIPFCKGKTRVFSTWGSSKQYGIFCQSPIRIRVTSPSCYLSLRDQALLSSRDVMMMMYFAWLGILFTAWFSFLASQENVCWKRQPASQN